MTELRACPFCGGKAQLHSWEDDDVYLVGCDHCNVTTRHCSGASDAIAAWNRRADDWMPIWTVPRDGTEVLTWSPISGVDMWALLLESDGWIFEVDYGPTHWRPLPEGPR